MDWSVGSGSSGWDWTATGLIYRLCVWLFNAKRTRNNKGQQGLHRGRSDAQISFFLREKIDRLEGECVAYLSPMGWSCIYSRCFTSWMVIRIISHWMGYFLPLLISDSIKDIESAVYLELSLSLIGGTPLDLQDEL